MIKNATAIPSQRGSSSNGDFLGEKRGALLYSAALLTVGAAVLHFMGAPGQMAQSMQFFALLLLSGLVQIVSAGVLVIVPTRGLLFATMLLDGLATLLWIMTHTIGLPVGFPFDMTLWQPELLSVVDLFLPVMEGLAALFLLILLVRSPRGSTSNLWRTALATLPAFLLINLLTWGLPLTRLYSNNPVLNEAWLPASSHVSAPAGRTTTLAYCRPDGLPLAMDVSEPRAQAPRPAPVVIDIPAGAGITGYRQLWSDSDRLSLARLRDQLLGHGFVFVSIDYRLGPLYPVAAQIEDAKCAVRFLRAHAHELMIDPLRIGLYGNSYGAYLASMVGTAGPGAGFDVGQYPNDSSRVQAVVSIGGLSDLANERATPSGTRTFMQVLHGSAISTPAYSPLTYVSPDDPPFLLLYGTDHPFGRPLNAQELATRLHAMGVPATLVLVQHGGDGLNAAPAGKSQQPGPEALVQMISTFFVTTLQVA